MITSKQKPAAIQNPGEFYAKRKDALRAELREDRIAFEFVTMPSEQQAPILKEYRELRDAANEGHDRADRDRGDVEKAQAYYIAVVTRYDYLRRISKAPSNDHAACQNAIRSSMRANASVAFGQIRNAVIQSCPEPHWSPPLVDAMSRVVEADLIALLIEYNVEAGNISAPTPLKAPLDGSETTLSDQRRAAITKVLGPELVERIDRELQQQASHGGASGAIPSATIRPAGVFDSCSREKTFNPLQTERLLSL